MVAIPAELVGGADEAREHLIEAIADYDDALLEIPRGAGHRRRGLKAAIRKATLDDRDDAGAVRLSFKNKGVQPLLDAVIDYLPSPLDVPPVEGIEPSGARTSGRPADPGADDASRSPRSRSRSWPTRSSAS